MITIRILNTALLCALVACLLQPALADEHNLLQDASFEQTTPPGEGGWQPFEDSTFSETEARTGKQSMYSGGLSRTVTYQPFFVGTVSGSFQEFPATPGSRWQLTGYGMAATALEGTPAFGILQISFFDAEGNDLGTAETAGSEGAKAKTSNEVNSQTPAGEWVLLDTGIATAPEGTSVVHAFTLYVDYSGSNVPQGVFFDDLILRSLDED